MTNVFQRPIRPSIVLKSMPGPSDLHVPTGKLRPVKGKRKTKGAACPSNM